MYAFRTSDARRLASFWGTLMQLPISENSTDDLVMLDFDHKIAPVTWLFERHDDIGKDRPRITLDLALHETSDWRSLAERAEQLGATRRAENELNGVVWIEMDDPDGNPFRVFGPRPT